MATVLPSAAACPSQCNAAGANWIQAPIGLRDSATIAKSAYFLLTRSSPRQERLVGKSYSMDPRSILDKANGGASAPSPALARHEAAESTVPDDVRFPGEDGGKSLAEMAQRDLSATLQLLAERAQYITGASGTAIALRDHEEMVCRASAGPSAPEVGAQLQVNSGLSGERVRTRQTLRCDDAFTDERVNRESCEALGIRSVVEMPLIAGAK